MKLYIFLVSLFFLNGCKGDYTVQLSPNYVYRSESSDCKDILSLSPGHVQIFSKVIGYKYNKNFIIALQQPIKEYHIIAIVGDLRSKCFLNDNNYNETANDEIKFRIIADSILKNDPYYIRIFTNANNYWIISNNNNIVYGPLTKEEYIQKRKQLHIPNDLVLNNG